MTTALRPTSLKRPLFPPVFAKSTFEPREFFSFSLWGEQFHQRLGARISPAVALDVSNNQCTTSTSIALEDSMTLGLLGINQHKGPGGKAMWWGTP